MDRHDVGIVPPFLAVIVVTYQSGRHIRRLLDSVPAAADDLAFRVLVVDNGSRDESVAIAREYPFVEAIDTGGNLGYAGGINVGMRHLPDEATAVAILNPDLRLGPRSLRLLYDELATTGVGVAVPKILNADGSVYLSMFTDATLRATLGDALFGARLPRRPTAWTQTVRDLTQYDAPRTVECPSGAAWLVRADVLGELGDWDESYFLYSEEFEYARRIRGAGHLIRYCPGAVVHHEEHGSGTSAQLQVLLAVNKLRDFERHRGPVAVRAHRSLSALHHLLRVNQPASRHVLRLLGRRDRWASYIEVLRDRPCAPVIADHPAVAAPNPVTSPVRPGQS